MKCLKCEENLFTFENGYTITAVYFPSPLGHNHDDNCKVRVYECKNGHNFWLSPVNKCHKCDWRGQKECFCSIKVEQWPDEK